MKSVLFSKNLMTDALIDVRTCPEKETQLHHHEFFELVYVLRGNAEHTIDGHSMIISEGDYFLINLKSSHGYSSLNGNDFELINCLFMPQFVDRTLAGTRSFREIMNNYLVNFGYRNFSDTVTQSVYRDSDGFVRTLFERMLSEFNEKRSGYFDVIRNLLLTLLIYLARNDYHDNKDAKNPASYIKERVRESYMKDISLSDISRELGMSLTYTSLVFKRETNTNFRDFLLKFRIEKACDLLRISDKTVSEISELVGYSDAAFFYKTFKKHLGMTPNEYRAARCAKAHIPPDLLAQCP